MVKNWVITSLMKNQVKEGEIERGNLANFGREEN